MNFRENEPLCHHTTLRTGGPARFFAEATTQSEILSTVSFAQERGLPLLVLGGGSNVLAGDAGFPGVVAKVANRGIQTHLLPDGQVEVIAEAGEEWDALVAFAVERALHGLENMSLIPGTVGAAVAGNIGAYGAEVKDSLRWTETLDMRTGALRRWTCEECAFGYRRSFFKSAEGRHFIVLRAAFVLRHQGTLNTGYRDVRDYFSAHGGATPTLGALRDAIIDIRRRKLPDPLHVGTAGSFFKNPVIPRPDYEALAARYPGLPGHAETDGFVKVPLGWILDKVCGLKGVRRGRTGTHAGQALVIVNEGGTAAEVEALAQEMASIVQARTGLVIEWEVERIS